MDDQLSFARDVLRAIAIGIHTGHIKARDIEFLYNDGPKRVTVLQLAVDAVHALDAEIAQCKKRELFKLTNAGAGLNAPSGIPAERERCAVEVEGLDCAHRCGVGAEIAAKLRSNAGVSPPAQQTPPPSSPK